MRKKPLQPRSRAMVDALIEATAQGIAEQGLADLSTNRIAVRAGVSVGSLYQYFENKEALVDALLDRMVRELLALVDERIAGVLEADVQTAVSTLLEAAFDFVQADAARLELIRHWQQLRSQRAIVALERHMLEVCRQYLLRHAQRLRVDNLPAALFVIISSTLYTAVHYLGTPRPMLPRRDVIAAQAAMIAAYLENASRSAA